METRELGRVRKHAIQIQRHRLQQLVVDIGPESRLDSTALGSCDLLTSDEKLEGVRHFNLVAAR